MFDRHKGTWLAEHYKVCDSYDECDYEFGGGDYFITDEDIELLKAGKIINFSVNDEYGCTLAYKMEERHERQCNDNGKTDGNEFHGSGDEKDNGVAEESELAV